MKNLIDPVIYKYRQKTYAELLALPEHFLLKNSEMDDAIMAHFRETFQVDKVTMEFIRLVQDDGVLKIFFRRVYWKTPEQMLEKYKQQYISLGYAPEEIDAKAAKDLKNMVANDWDMRERGYTGIVSEKVRQEHPDMAYPILRPQCAPHLLFGGLYCDYYVLKYKDESSISADEEIDALVKRQLARRETADWFGKTGLNDETERGLSRYLRLELGEFFDDDEENTLKASDLQYLGLFELTPADREAAEDYFAEEVQAVHLWKITTNADDTPYAYVELYPDGTTGMLMGDYLPENARKA